MKGTEDRRVRNYREFRSSRLLFFRGEIGFAMLVFRFGCVRFGWTVKGDRDEYYRFDGRGT